MGLELRGSFDSPERKLALNKRLFSTIAPRYDLITRVLSYGQDARWKKKLAQMAKVSAGERALDLASGTGDIAIAIAERGASGFYMDVEVDREAGRPRSRRSGTGKCEASSSTERRDSRFLRHPSLSCRATDPSPEIHSRGRHRTARSNSMASCRDPTLSWPQDESTSRNLPSESLAVALAWTSGIPMSIV